MKLHAPGFESIAAVYVTPPQVHPVAHAFRLVLDGEDMAVRDGAMSLDGGAPDLHTSSRRSVHAESCPEDAGRLATEIALVRAWIDGLRDNSGVDGMTDRREIDVVSVSAVGAAAQDATPEDDANAPSMARTRRASLDRQTKGTETVVVNVRATRDGTVATLEFNHRSLGPIHMELTITGARMVAYATAAEPRAVAILVENEPQLRDSVRDLGFELHVLRVSLQKRGVRQPFRSDHGRRAREEL